MEDGLSFFQMAEFEIPDQHFFSSYTDRRFSQQQGAKYT